jgi:hypothetical protein
MLPPANRNWQLNYHNHNIETVQAFIGILKMPTHNPTSQNDFKGCKINNTDVSFVFPIKYKSIYNFMECHSQNAFQTSLD